MLSVCEFVNKIDNISYKCIEFYYIVLYIYCIGNLICIIYVYN